MTKTEQFLAKYHPDHLEGWLTINIIAGKFKQLYSDTICTIPAPTE